MQKSAAVDCLERETCSAICCRPRPSSAASAACIVASSFLLLGERSACSLVPWLISYAVGTLIGVALLALVPEALAELPPRPAMLTMAGGILSFFLLEKAVIWRHCHHDEDCHVHSTRRVAGDRRRRVPHLRRRRGDRGGGADLRSRSA